MFKVPQPKYDVGQVLWFANCESYMKRETCPDCLGEKEWHVRLPNGEEFEIECSTCRQSWSATGQVGYQDYLPFAQEVTIAQVRVDTTHADHPVSYMTEETGCPSGSILWEEQLFLTKAEAESHAETLAAQRRDYMEKCRLETVEREKKRTRYKPSWEKRRIRELEKQVKQLKKNQRTDNAPMED